LEWRDDYNSFNQIIIEKEELRKALKRRSKNTMPINFVLPK
jgi:diphthamide synthase subunit DPH2